MYSTSAKQPKTFLFDVILKLNHVYLALAVRFFSDMSLHAAPLYLRTLWHYTNAVIIIKCPAA